MAIVKRAGRAFALAFAAPMATAEVTGAGASALELRENAYIAAAPDAVYAAKRPRCRRTFRGVWCLPENPRRADPESGRILMKTDSNPCPALRAPESDCLVGVGQSEPRIVPGVEPAASRRLWVGSSRVNF
jgi:hypothetical protein